MNTKQAIEVLIGETIMRTHKTGYMVSDRYVEAVQEIAKAEQEGRLVELPVSLGQLVYCLHNKYNHVLTGVVFQINYEDGNVDFRRNNSFCVDCSPEIEVGTKNWFLYLHYTADDIGKTVFLTRQEAEKALERPAK